MNPDQFHVRSLTEQSGTFANNDLAHEDPSGAEHDLYADGLVKSLYNFMHGLCLDHPLQNWFDHKVPKTSLPHDLIEMHLAQPQGREIKANHTILWVGGPAQYATSESVLKISTRQESLEIDCPIAEGQWLVSILPSLAPGKLTWTYQQFQTAYETQDFPDFTLFWYGSVMEQLKEIGLLVL
jgi:hypothetical protein